MQPPNSPDTDLAARLSQVEYRLQVLEAENQRLRQAALAPRESVDGRAIARYVHQALPRTNLINPAFLKRAFAVWGHFFVANLIISLMVAVVYGCVMIAFVALLGASFGTNW
jgi:hypothetical protein